MRALKLSFALIATLLLTACNPYGGWLATVGPDYQQQALKVATEWQAPQPILPHQGQPAALKQFWAGFQDPILDRLLDAAQQQSASVASAFGRIAQARANLISSDAALLPSLDSSLVAKRSSSSFGGTPFVWNQYQAGLQSNWEIDLFGGLVRQQEAANSQLESRNAAWHDARVSVAAELANAYLAYRYCEIQVRVFKADSESRLNAAKMSAIAAAHGFRSPADDALNQATAAEGQRNLLQQQGQCERDIKGLVALTGLEEAELRPLLHTEPLAQLPKPPPFSLEALPAKALLQRPDLVAAERDVAEASANIGVEQAKRFPRLSLSGSITPTLQNINGSAFMLAQTWSIGPTLSLPLFDGGKRAANVEAAIAQYEAASSNFKSKVRTAIKEVEEALVRIQIAALRLPEAQKADSNYRQYFQASQTLHTAGLGNLLDVETARRNALNAELAVKEVEQEQVSAWIALYRAAGGSWETPDNDAAKTNGQPNNTQLAIPTTETKPAQNGEKS